MIFTYYIDELANIFIRSVKSFASNLIDSQLDELIIICKKDIPTKLLKQILPFFRKIHQVRQSLPYLSFVDECPIEVLTKYNSYDRWYFDPKIIITSDLPNPSDSNIFFKLDDPLLSLKLFYIRSNSKLPNLIDNFLDTKYLDTKCKKLLNAEFSYLIANNFLISKYIQSKPILTFNNLVDSKIDSIDLSKVQGIDIFECLGSKYTKLKLKIENHISTQPNIKSKKSKSKKLNQSQTFKNINHPDQCLNRDSDRISIIMTNYNNEALIQRAITSVINQTHKNWELLIVDDASTDSSIDKILELANTDDRIRVFQNIEQCGTYWSKNSVISKTTGMYITMIDSDDYDLPNRLEKQFSKFKNPNVVCVTCLNDRKVSEYSNITEKITLGYPSMMFRYEVFSELGFYDTVKFGADSEFYDRVILFYGKRRISHIPEVLQISPRCSKGLTSIIPERSKSRLKYLTAYRAWHNSDCDHYVQFPTSSRKFQIDPVSRVPYFDLSNSRSIQVASNTTLPIIMCVWKRLDGFIQTIRQLNLQTFKDFKLFVWNNNPELDSEFRAALKNHAKFKYEFHSSEKNVGGFGRFFYAKQIRRSRGLLDYCVFIDDDQEFGPDTIQIFMNEAQPNTILSQWGWQFTTLQYYGESRLQRLPGETVHYAGTGGMIVDMRIFDSEGLFKCPTKYWFVEDLWLSYYANHILNYKLLKSAAVIKNGDDQHSLYKIVKDVKTPMLIDLITNKGWDILPK